MPVTDFSVVKLVATTYAIALIAGCSPPAEEISLDFAAVFNGQAIDCKSSASPAQLTDLRFYVHDIVVMTEDGSTSDVATVPDDIWQDETVALVDLETGEGACLNGTSEIHSTVIGTYPGGSVTGIRFRIGVPATLNHQDPLNAGPPLGYSVMHWHWASGYKFMRAGIEQHGDSVFLHLGSSRCEGTIGDIRGCKSANRPMVSLDGFDPLNDRIVLDLGLLFAETGFADGDRSNCMSGPVNPACSGPFGQLGIAMETGEPLGPAPAFSSSPKP